ncbi:TRAP transporter substrate-binding protein [Parasphingorhabdus litoris]|uniref:TRAP transporter substrate-binding protein n=1 Tax=Parasphingorhabdus litoris TaxID=394733 RepID=A0ABP3KNL8_9SPHN|nr:TRAP transporter substrate-binding protein [Parasphingorhabdus litoris]
MTSFPLSRRALLTGAAGLGAAALAGCDRTAAMLGEGGVLRAADTHPDGYPTVEAVRSIAARLKEQTDGRLNVRLYTGGQLGEEKDTLELAIFGGLDFNRVNLAPLNSIAPETLVPALPFLFRDESHMRAAMDGTPGHTILEALRPHGLIGLCFYDSGARSFYTSSREITKPADLKGLKIRVQNSDLYVAMIEALGGDATPMAYGEVYQGLMQGVVDGAENNWPSYESSRHFEAAGTYSLTRHVMAPEVLLVSGRSWAKLSEDDRTLIRQSAKESVPLMRTLWDQRTNDAKTRLAEAGVTVIEPDFRAFSEKVQPVWDKFLATPHLRKLAEDMVAISG